jgi:hypothetical protein
MLDMDDISCENAEVFQKASRLPSGFQAALQLILPPGEIIVLNIDQEQCGVLQV